VTTIETSSVQRIFGFSGASLSRVLLGIKEKLKAGLVRAEAAESVN
jgi:hypothetical protein